MVCQASSASQRLAVVSAGVNYHEGAEFVRASLARDQDVVIDLNALQQACQGFLLTSWLSSACLDAASGLCIAHFTVFKRTRAILVRPLSLHGTTCRVCLCSAVPVG